MLSIMQPHFIPWLGYFYLILKSNNFVILDNVQFDKRSWQQRNLIFSNNKSEWLTIPVSSKGKYTQKINEVKIENKSNFQKKHLSKIFHNYKKHEFFDPVYCMIEKIYNKKHEYLIDLSLDFINSISLYLNFKFKFILASSINIKGSKADLIYNIIKKFDDNIYISPEGSKSYIQKSTLFNNINVKYLKYIPINYSKDIEFISNLSIIDLLFHKGPKGLEFIEKSFYLE